MELTNYTSNLPMTTVNNSLNCSSQESTFNGENNSFQFPTNIPTPSLSDAILETDIFLRSFGIKDDPLPPSEKKNSEVTNGSKIDIGGGAHPVPISMPMLVTAMKRSPNSTPTNLSPIATPKTGSPVFPGPHDLHSLEELLSRSHADFGGQSENRLPPGGSFRHFSTGLDPIPEYKETGPPATFQPLVPPPVPLPATTSYNICFPTTLQPRDRFDIWRGHGSTLPLQLQIGTSGSRYSSGTGSSCSSADSSLQSPFHEASNTSPWDLNDFQPLNVIEESSSSSVKFGNNNAASSSTTSSSGSKQKLPYKRSRTNTPTNDEMEDLNDGVSSRQRRKSIISPSASGANTTESKRRDSIKSGLEELQRILPHFGPPEEEKISQATILFEAGKYIKSLKHSQAEGTDLLANVRADIDELNKQIELLQSELPDNGAPFAVDSRALTVASRSLPELFRDHVVERTHDDWRYWVFTSIMGHFVHSFGQEVAATSMQDLETTSIEWITNAMSLQQLRKDAYRKLAKLCAKTSIVEDPSKLPEEALRFVSFHRRKKAESK